jgi:starch synthase
MRIVHIVSECAPFAKSGGLGDVVYGLSRMTARYGHAVEVIVPFYKSIQGIHNESKIDEFSLKLSHEQIIITVYYMVIHEIPVYLIDCDTKKNLFNRTSIYGEDDDAHRFLSFCYFSLCYLERKKQITPFILHLHDWPTAFTPYFLSRSFKELSHHVLGCILTIHNLQHQGITHKNHFTYFGYASNSLPNLFHHQGNPDYINLLKSGIDTVNHCTVVSPTYLKEIQTKEFGFGLEQFIKEHIHKFSAILNGIDTQYWNPLVDPFLHRNYRADALIDHVIEEKYRNKHYLQKKLGLDPSHRPLFVFITRLVEQKGPWLILESIKEIIKKGCQCVLLGSEPSAELKEAFQEIDKPGQVYMDFKYQEGLSHLCFAAADAIIVPSIFEPCGLTQMIAMRYGAIPIVRKTGGLADTVHDIEHSNMPLKNRNGFVFEYPTLDSMDYIITRAIDCFDNNQEQWKTLMKTCLLQDHSFEVPASLYIAVYQTFEKS